MGVHEGTGPHCSGGMGGEVVRERGGVPREGEYFLGGGERRVLLERPTPHPRSKPHGGQALKLQTTNSANSQGGQALNLQTTYSANSQGAQALNPTNHVLGK